MVRLRGADEDGQIAVRFDFLQGFHYLEASHSFRIVRSTPFSVLITVKLVSMTARSSGISKWRFSSKLVAMAEVAGRQDAGYGL